MLRYHEWTFRSCDTDAEHKVTDIRLYSDDAEKILIELKPVSVYPPEQDGLAWEDWNRYDSICIYKTDYERLLLPSIEALFPVTDPDPNGFGVQETFDRTSINFFGKDDWQRLIGGLTGCMETAEGSEKAFYSALIRYLKECTAVSEWFCIEGNL